jgi:hypothetical protein
VTPDELRALPAAADMPALAALWWQARGDWARAHEAAQADEGADAAWVHALLHREEGDLGNADYWYRRAGKRRPAGALREEWEEWEAIAAALLAAG